MGPVQVLVVGFDRPRFSGEVLAEFTRLGEAGIVRLVDLLLVSRADDGTFQPLTPPAGVDSGLGRLATALLARAEAAVGRDVGEADVDPDDVAAWSLSEAVPPGSSAAVALIEHLWAEPLRVAIRRAGGTPLEETWLSPGDLDLLDVLIAQRDDARQREVGTDESDP